MAEMLHTGISEHCDIQTVTKNLSIQSLKIAFIRARKVSGAFRSPMDMKRNSKWQYFVLNAVFSMSSGAILIWWKLALRPDFEKH